MLQYVGKHGSISRGEAAELCRLGSLQAYRLLKRLEKQGKIRWLGGSTKNVRYGSTSNYAEILVIDTEQIKGLPTDAQQGPVIDGYVTTPDEPGLGPPPDWEALEKRAVLVV